MTDERVIDAAAEKLAVCLQIDGRPQGGLSLRHGRPKQKAGEDIRRGVRGMLDVNRELPSFIIIWALTSGCAQAQNLDQDKSGAHLFAATCAECHRSPRGLAKDRFSWTLSYFLRQHYTSSSSSAQVLTAYLQSVEAPRGKPQPATRKSSSPAASGEPVLRPPARVQR
jgi:hypothetical protein